MTTRAAPRGRWLVLVAGVLAVAVGAALLLTSRQLPPSFSAASSTAPAAAPPVTTTAAAPPAATASSAPPPTAVTPTAAVVPVAFRPATMTLSAFGVTAPVDPVFTAADGVLDPPDDPARLGWWGAGQLAGATAGTTVVVGHVDGPAGPGALYRLVHARAGDRFVVAGSNGQTMTYAVTSLAYHVKGSALPSSLFTPDGPPRLVVISCGGTFDRGDGQYEDNVVVEATTV